MKQILGCAVSGPLAVLGAAVLQLAVAGCGGDVTTGPGKDGGGGGHADCTLDPPGKTFTFHVHNGGTMMLRLTYGCSATLPIELETPSGQFSIGPGAVNVCEVKCDSVYAGQPNNGCSDCGPGYGAPLGPGMVADIAWDRRVYVAHTADPSCSGSPSGNECALGKAVAPSAAQKGVLTVCADAMMGGGVGYCASTDQSKVSFTIDTTADQGTIEVK